MVYVERIARPSTELMPRLATREELLRWRGFLQDEIRKLELMGAVHPLSNDPELFVFECISDALTARVSLEEAIEFFISNSRWPELSQEHTVYALHRALNARLLIDQLMANKRLFLQVKPPRGDNRPAFLRWLLIAMWDLAGPEYMKIWAEDYLAKNPPAKV